MCVCVNKCDNWWTKQNIHSVSTNEMSYFVTLSNHTNTPHFCFLWLHSIIHQAYLDFGSWIKECATHIYNMVNANEWTILTHSDALIAPINFHELIHLHRFSLKLKRSVKKDIVVFLLPHRNYILLVIVVVGKFYFSLRNAKNYLWRKFFFFKKKNKIQFRALGILLRRKKYWHHRKQVYYL